MIVVDTNVITYLWVLSKYTINAERLFMKDPEWAAPFLWRSEFQNVLANYLRKKALSLNEALTIFNNAKTCVENREFFVNPTQVFDLVTRSSCSAYDCEFAALAVDLRVQLVTGDKAIVNAFPKVARLITDY